MDKFIMIVENKIRRLIKNEIYKRLILWAI